MMDTGIQQAACRDAAHKALKGRINVVNKSNVMKKHSNHWPNTSEPDSNPLHK